MHHEKALVGGHPQHAGIVLHHGTGIVRREAFRTGKGLETDTVVRLHVGHQDAGAAGRHPHAVPTIFKERGDAAGARNIQFRLQVIEQAQFGVQEEDAGTFRSDPDAAEAVFGQALHQVVTHFRHCLVSVRFGDQSV